APQPPGPSAKGEGERWWNAAWETRLPLSVQEFAGVPRRHWPIVLQLREIPHWDALPWRSLRVVVDGQEVPYQIDDVNGNGQDGEDELAFQLDLPARRKRTVWLYFSSRRQPRPAYPSQVHAAAGGGTAWWANQRWHWDWLNAERGLRVAGEKGNWAAAPYLQFGRLVSASEKEASALLVGVPEDPPLGAPECSRWRLVPPRRWQVVARFGGPVRAGLRLRAEFAEFALDSWGWIYDDWPLLSHTFVSSTRRPEERVLLGWHFAIGGRAQDDQLEGPWPKTRRPRLQLRCRPWRGPELFPFIFPRESREWYETGLQRQPNRLRPLVQRDGSRGVALLYFPWDLHQRVEPGLVRRSFTQVWHGQPPTPGLGVVLPVDDLPRTGYFLVFAGEGPGTCPSPLAPRPGGNEGERPSAPSPIPQWVRALEHRPLTAPGPQQRLAWPGLAVSPPRLSLLRLDQQTVTLTLYNVGPGPQEVALEVGNLPGVKWALRPEVVRLEPGAVRVIRLTAQVTAEQPLGTRLRTTVRLLSGRHRFNLPLRFLWNKPIYLTWVPFSNYLYASFRDEHLPHLMDTTYEPTLRPYKRHPAGRFNWAATGLTMEMIAREDPPLYALLRELLLRGQVEITLNAYSPDAAWFLPEWLYRAAMRKSLAVMEQFYAYRPAGTWPPEAVRSPVLPDLLSELGLRYLAGFGILGEPRALRGRRGGLVFRGGEPLPRQPGFEKFNGVLTGIGGPVASPEEIVAYLKAVEKWLMGQERDHLFHSGGQQDAEFGSRAAEAQLERLLAAVERLPYVQCLTYAQYFARHPPSKEQPLKETHVCANGDRHSGSPQDLALNALNYCLHETLAAQKSLTVASPPHPLRRRWEQQAERELHLIDSTETRGFNPSPARVLYGYQHSQRGQIWAQAAQRLALADLRRAQVEEEAAERGKGPPAGVTVTLVETLGVARMAEPVEFTADFPPGQVGPDSLYLVDERGHAVPVQILSSTLHPDGTLAHADLIFLADVPAQGVRTYLLSTNPPSTPESAERANSPSPLTSGLWSLVAVSQQPDSLCAVSANGASSAVRVREVKGYVLENDRLRLELDPQRGGQVVSLRDQATNTEYLAPGGALGRVSLYANELGWWLSDGEVPAKVEIVSAGPVCVRVKRRARLQPREAGAGMPPVEVGPTHTSWLTLYAGQPYLDLVSEVDFPLPLSVGEGGLHARGRLAVGEGDWAGEAEGMRVTCGMVLSDTELWTRPLPEGEHVYFLGWENWLSLGQGERERVAVMSDGATNVFHQALIARAGPRVTLAVNGGHDTKTGRYGEDERHGLWQRSYRFRLRFLPGPAGPAAARRLARQFGRPLLLASEPYFRWDGKALWVVNPGPRRSPPLTVERVWPDVRGRWRQRTVSVPPLWPGERYPVGPPVEEGETASLLREGVLVDEVKR
ncbi:MAG TPA: DUF4861 domain-containing protein, partial [Armatimonadetes bacterium]|nr:DUF4861 domain-containing protein [Armatimonadota bacterium]